MVIASIDIQNGKVVQLKQGSQLMLQRDNPQELIREFDRYGEVALIDLDAAMGTGNNEALIKPLLRLAQCRVGGGIRSVERAGELVSLGASKIIVGSAAFRDNAKKEAGFAPQFAWLEKLVAAIGRQRVIVAIDSRDGEITIDGWKTSTALPLVETARALEPYAGEFLFTCVEREGTMTGIDLDRVRELRSALSATLTVAGGVSTLEEISALAKLGCDVQLGMALYTGKVQLSSAFTASLNWEKAAIFPAPEAVSPNASAATDAATASAATTAGAPDAAGPALLPVIAQAPDGQVLMTGFTSREAVAESFKRGRLCFHSRTRNKLWMKGESSGHTLNLLRIRADCDRDALLATVEGQGPVCHSGAYSCFETGRAYTWEYLESIIAGRFRNPVSGSYTATLDDPLVREKIMEEAEEVCTAKTHDEVVWEAADLLYFLTVLMVREKVSVKEVLAELDRRHKK
jgi:phosphoribosyl-ATP pyrophosphohydrolase/phosphoribosyl-AMP cyclohydrolase